MRCGDMRRGDRARGGVAVSAPLRHTDGVAHHLDGADQPRAVLPLARYTHLLAVEAAAVADVAG